MKLRFEKVCSELCTLCHDPALVEDYLASTALSRTICCLPEMSLVRNLRQHEFTNPLNAHCALVHSSPAGAPPTELHHMQVVCYAFCRLYPVWAVGNSLCVYKKHADFHSFHLSIFPISRLPFPAARVRSLLLTGPGSGRHHVLARSAMVLRMLSKGRHCNMLSTTF